jgi:serine/threonine protein kinase
MLAPNTLLQNRYQIIRSIGHGGMGAVYLARDQRLGHTVALKETFFTEERMRRAFEREARLLAHLRHPALPKVTDHFDEDGGQFIVMEFISGDDLEMLLAQRGQPFEMERVLAWADELLKALAYLHNQDPPILHRDIKPANLKLTPQGEIILLDFGLAKGTAGQTASVMTSRSVFGFTPNFAPLEQIQGTGTGPRSDLYALAATLYYLMTGAIPPDALTRITAVANGQADPLRPADEVNPQIPREVAEILMKTMAHNRDHRPESAAEMRRLLREARPALVSMSVDLSETNGSAAKMVDSEAKTVMPSTVIEAAPTQDIPAAVETAASPTAVAPTAHPSVSAYEAVAAEESAQLLKPEKRANRLPWAIAAVAATLLVAITFALISNFGSSKASDADKVDKLASKDAVSSAAPAIPVSEQLIAAPDDSEIATTTDANGTKTETRTFKSHPRVAKLIITTGDGKQLARVYFRTGEERDLPVDKIQTALEASGDELALAVSPVEEKGKSAPGAKVASRKSTPPVKAPAQNVASKPDTNSDNKGISNNPVQSPIGKKESQSRAAGIENMIPVNGTEAGAKKSTTKP